MRKSILKLAMIFATAAMLATSAPKPAVAQSQGTINTLLGVAAAVGGIILYNNYVHKKQAANTIVGYTVNGGTIYGDGRIVMPNNQVYHPNANGQYPWGAPVYYSPTASTTMYNYDYNRTGEYDRTGRHGRGHAYGLYKTPGPGYSHQKNWQGPPPGPPRPPHPPGHGQGHDKDRGGDQH